MVQEQPETPSILSSRIEYLSRDSSIFVILGDSGGRFWLSRSSTIVLIYLKTG